MTRDTSLDGTIHEDTVRSFEPALMSGITIIKHPWNFKHPLYGQKFFWDEEKQRCAARYIKKCSPMMCSCLECFTRRYAESTLYVNHREYKTEEEFHLHLFMDMAMRMDQKYYKAPKKWWQIWK